MFRDVLASSHPDNDPLVEVAATRKLVVVIGIDQYVHWPRLHNAVSDALGVQKVLVEKFGFEAPIAPLVNAEATKPAVEALVRDTLRATVRPDDSLVLFYAGHGHNQHTELDGIPEDIGFLAPVEARPGDHYGDLLGIEELLKAIGRLNVRHILVVLDACHSGMALGKAADVYRSAETFVKELATKRSRRVITSAMAKQRALDGGPIPGHSLFTGTLIDALTWGKADMDCNGIISSSELGLYLQQKVGQSSESRQTPDFGSFHRDDRGELLISLGQDNFPNVVARAYSALQSGDRIRFTELVERAGQLRPGSPEALYLRYRCALASSDLVLAYSALGDLYDLQPKDGIVPLSRQQIYELKAITAWWRVVFSIPSTAIPLTVSLVKGRDESSMCQSVAEPLGDLQVHTVDEGNSFAFDVVNPTGTTHYLYLVHVGPSGAINVLRVWGDFELEYRGLGPGVHNRSYLYHVGGELGLEELWLFSSERRVDVLIRPPSIMTREVLTKLDDDDATGITMTKLYLHTRARPRLE